MAWASAAVVTVTVVVACLFVLVGWDRGDESSDVVPEPAVPPATTETLPSTDDAGPVLASVTGPPPDPNSPTFGYDPGWYELDSGPLDPRKGAAAVWDGGGIYVVGGSNHIDGAIYEPLTGRWHHRIDPPFGPQPAIATNAVSAGVDVVVLRRTGSEGERREMAAYSRMLRRWRTLPEPPPPVQGPTGEMVWTGAEVILVDAAAALDLDSDTWRSLDLPSPGGDVAVAWTGTELVMARSGAPTVVYDPATDTHALADPAPDHDTGESGGVTAGIAAFGQVVIVDELGRTSSFDVASRQWTAETILPVLNPGPCQPEGFGLDDGRSVWDLCGELWLRSFHGEWESAGPSPIACCLRGTVGTGAFLLSWMSNDDTANDPSAPFARLLMWVPPEASAPRLVMPDDTYEGYIRGIDLAGPEPVVTIELIDHFFGEDAERETQADGITGYPEEFDAPYYMRAWNLPPVALEAAKDAELWGFNMQDPDLPAIELPVEWDNLARVYNEPRRPTDDWMMWMPVQIEVVDGVVVSVRQFYTP